MKAMATNNCRKWVKLDKFGDAEI